MVDVLAHPGDRRAQDQPRAVRRRDQHLHARRHDGRRQGAADGHQPRAGPELRQGVRHHLLVGGRRQRARLDHLVGLVHPHARRPDHVPRRRQRAAGAAAAGADPGARHGRQGRRRRAARPRPSCATRCATPACGSASTTGSTPRSAAGPSTPSSRAIRYGSRSARATSPPATSSLVRRVDGSKTPVPVADVVGRGARRARRGPAGAATTQALARRESRTVDVSTLDEAIEAAGDGLGAGAVVGGRASTARRRPTAQGVTVRCLIRADGSVPDSEDEPDLVASCAPLVLSCGHAVLDARAGLARRAPALHARTTCSPGSGSAGWSATTSAGCWLWVAGRQRRTRTSARPTARQFRRVPFAEWGATAKALRDAPLARGRADAPPARRGPSVGVAVRVGPTAGSAAGTSTWSSPPSAGTTARWPASTPSTTTSTSWSRRTGRWRWKDEDEFAAHLAVPDTTGCDDEAAVRAEGGGWSSGSRRARSRSTAPGPTSVPDPSWRCPGELPGGWDAPAAWFRPIPPTRLRAPRADLAQWCVGIRRAPAPSTPGAPPVHEQSTAQPHCAGRQLTHASQQERTDRGRTDPASADGQDPQPAVPHRRRRLAHQARRPGDRVHRASTTRRRTPRASRSSPTGCSTGSPSAPSRASRCSAILAKTGDWQKFKGLPAPPSR